MSDLILCLYNSEGCISSITFDIYKDKNTISSRTTIGCENKKYNKILRCVSIIISNKINKNINFLISNALNPLSVISFCNSFDFIIYKKGNEYLFEYMGLGKNVFVINSDNKPNDFNEKLIFFYNVLNKWIDIIYIPLNKQNIEKARHVFNHNLQILDSNPCAYPNKTSTIISTSEEEEEESKVQPENNPMAVEQLNV